MKAKIDASLCTGCGLCADIAPEVFELTGEVAEVIADPVPAAAEAKAKEAAESCPVEAIILS